MIHSQWKRVKLDPLVAAAILTVLGAILVAVIEGIFSLYISE